MVWTAWQDECIIAGRPSQVGRLFCIGQSHMENRLPPGDKNQRFTGQKVPLSSGFGPFLGNAIAKMAKCDCPIVMGTVPLIWAKFGLLNKKRAGRMSNAYSYGRLGNRGDVRAVCGGLGSGVWEREVRNLRFLKVNRSNGSVERDRSIFGNGF
jgi:hypothetical protein